MRPARPRLFSRCAVRRAAEGGSGPPRALSREAPIERFRTGLGRAALKIALLPWALYGFVVFSFGLAMYFVGTMLVFPRYLLGLDPELRAVTEWIVWYSGLPVVAGLCLVVGDLLLLLGLKRTAGEVAWRPLADRRVTVALTAYNDELSIGDAVKDLRAHPLVANVIVVSNNSRDATFDIASAAGAIAVNETRQGYGWCVHRCLSEALALGETELIVLSEGDGTFRAFDIEKLLAYAPHADVVNGTRTVERLRQPHTQLTTFMYYGNLFVGKLLEAKHLGRSTITDVGTTYKLCRRDALERLLPRLNPAINLEFNAHFLDTALAEDLALVECPITFHPRIGVSKGGNASNLRAAKVGCAMMAGILFGWRRDVAR